MAARLPWRMVLGLMAALPAASPAQNPSADAKGKPVYEKACVLCHGPGLAGAPRFGDAADWGKRARAGMPALYRSALQGTPKGMPGKGGNLTLTDAEVRAAVDYMVAAAGAAPRTAAARPPEKKPAAVTAANEVREAAPAPAAAPARPAVVVAAAAAEPAATPGDPNQFNRLLAAPGARNLPPALDGIHDPANPGTAALQAPRASFEPLPRSNSGNRVDWGAALDKKQIRPRAAVADGAAPPAVMDLNIVREVKGSMPDVVYPHKQHTEWLDCSNCHPAIFVPQKGANQISMAAILLGQKCGVCHGKVAFPVSECRLCHSKKKDALAGPAGAAAVEGRP